MLFFSLNIYHPQSQGPAHCTCLRSEVHVPWHNIHNDQGRGRCPSAPGSGCSMSVTASRASKMAILSNPLCSKARGGVGIGKQIETDKSGSSHCPLSGVEHCQICKNMSKDMGLTYVRTKRDKSGSSHGACSASTQKLVIRLTAVNR